ncbi:MAG TPA: nitroreductase family protein [Planctomycetota bacterium]|jgi:nitroreductase
MPADDLFDLLRSRRSIRKFKPEPVPRATLEHLVSMAAWAPSAGNRQDWLFTVVTAAETKQAMAEIVRRRWQEIVAANSAESDNVEFEAYTRNFDFFASAPAVIAVFARKVSTFQVHLMGEAAPIAGGSIVSVAMATQNLMLAAHALGLGTCCLTGAVAARQALEQLLHAGRRHELICLVALGIADETPAAPTRKDVSEIARFIE